MRFLFSICVIVVSNALIAQDTNTSSGRCSISGYIKELQMYRFDKSFSTALATSLIHNRVNIEWHKLDKIMVGLALRNRLYWGDDVILNPTFEKQLNNENEKYNLSVLWAAKESYIIHSNIERLWLAYRIKNWNIRIGRQRINWAVNNFWNPNDIFNNYSLLDFDYEERTGCDAIKAQYVINQVSNMDFIYCGTLHKSITAARYYTNYMRYDWQLNAGLYKDLPTAGIGWAGNISDVGFKGECQFYYDKGKSAILSNMSIEGDYIFKKGWYLCSGVLFNNVGENKPSDKLYDIKFISTPLLLMPAKWNLLIHSSKEINLLLNFSISIIYAPGMDYVILFPNVKYNLTNNLDFDITAQSFLIKRNNYEATTNNFFCRIKFSY